MKTQFKRIAAYILLLIISFLWANFTQGQKIKATSIESGGMGYSILGKSFINLGDLNSHLESRGYTAMSDNFFTVGGGGHAIMGNRWIIGGEGFSLLGDDVTGNNHKQSITIGCGFFNLGYVVYSIHDLIVYPMLGIGGGGMSFKISEDISSVTFDNILDDPERNTEITTSEFLLDLGGGISYLLSFGKDETDMGGMFIGIRGGYMISPFRGDWMLDDIEITGAPDMGIKGPYIRIMIGGGAITRK